MPAVEMTEYEVECLKKVFALQKENARLREALEDISSRVINTSMSVGDIVWQFSLCVQTAQKALAREV